MAIEVLSNSIGVIGTGTLAADPGAAGTVLTLTTGHGARFPAVASGYVMHLQVDTEIMTVTAHTAAADTMTITRGAETTTATAHAIGATANTVLTLASLRAVAAVVNPLNYGAIGNGTADDTAALTSAIAALNPGDTLLIPSGSIFTHTTVLAVTAAGVRVTGGGEIRATAEATSAFSFTANNPTIDNVTFTCPTTTVRGTTITNHKVILNHIDGAVLRHVHVNGSSGAGIFIYGSTNFTIESCLVESSRADGFHMVTGAHHGTVTNCSAVNTGDDGFAVVSYLTGGDAGLSHHIRVNNCKVDQVAGGRLFACVGGQDVEFSECYGNGSFAAGIIVSTETTVPTYDVQRVLIRDMHIRNANTLGTSQPNLGGFVIDAALSTSTINDVNLTNIKIQDTRAATGQASQLTTVAGAVISNIVMDSISFHGTQPAVKFYTNAPATSYKRFNIQNGEVSWGWELIGYTSLAAAAITTGAIAVTAYDELMIVVRIVGMSGADIPALRFNADSTANYWTRFITSAAGGAALANVQTVSDTMLRLSGVSTGGVRKSVVYLGDHAFWQKVCKIETSTGSGTPTAAQSLDVSGAGEWGNTAAQVTSVELLTAGGVVTMNSGSGIMIFGKNYTG